MNKGLIVKPIEPEHFVFGDAKLGDAPILTDGQWNSWLPIPENQNIGIEPMACTTFALLNAVETMIRQKFGSSENLCKKFLAYASGTTESGNDPHTVAEALRNKGDVEEEDYPYTAEDSTWEKFYAVPAQWLYTKALEFIAQYAFGHSWVFPINQQNMMNALNYSPLTAGVYAWEQDPQTGYYTNKQNLPPEHDVMIYGYLANTYWLIFDSYEQNTKKLAWDFPFVAVKRYTLSRNISNTPQSQSAWETFLYWMEVLIEGMQKGLGLGDYSPDRLCGAARSPQWPSVRAAHLLKEPSCQLCGGTSGLQVHHIRPFHIHPELELDPNNLITLCTGNNTINCHIRFGHLDNFKTKWNPNIREDCIAWKARFDAVKEQDVFPLELDTSV